MLREVKIYSTLSKEKEILKPVEDGHVKMYACGVTVYDEAHIGHAMQAIFFDVIRNYLQYSDYKVTYVRNFTDVDDKIINRSKKLGISPRQLADDMIADNRADLDKLGVIPATYEPKVSESIPEIINMIGSILEKKSAYTTNDGDVYYRVRNKKDYGKLSNRKLDELQSGTREIKLGTKEDELDFALWKKDEHPDASWPSPWCQGRPGWHIECSAMAKKYLGDTFDIHGGGRDLVFPHHENEIAQSETANCRPYANIWMHSGLLTIDHQKMSKSLDNFITIKEFLKDWSFEVLRLGYLQNHYRSNINFSKELFSTCRKRLLYYYETIRHLENVEVIAETGKESLLVNLQSYREDFNKHMSDDFNTPAAIASLNLLMRQANQFLKKKKSAQKSKTARETLSLIKEWGSVFGLFTFESNVFISDLKKKLLPDLGITESEINSYIGERDQARLDKNWSLSDEIRDKLLEKGIQVQDSSDSTTWTILQTIEDE